MNAHENAVYNAPRCLKLAHMGVSPLARVRRRGHQGEGLLRHQEGLHAALSRWEVGDGRIDGAVADALE